MKALFFLLMALYQTIAVAGEISDVSVTSRVVKKDFGVYLSFSVGNDSKNDIKMYKSSLPWGNVYSTLLIACLAKHGNPELQKKYYFDDPGPEAYILKKGSRTTGEIDLSLIFPTLRESLKESDVIVFWSFVLKDVNGNTSDRFGGMIVISKDR